MTRSKSRAGKWVKRSQLALAAAAAGVSLSSSVFAASGSWTFSFSGDWGTASNWAGGVVASGTDAVATFGGFDAPADINVQLTPTGFTVGSLFFSDTDAALTPMTWRIQGSNTLTLDVSSGSAVINVGTLGSNAAFIETTVAGNDGLQKDGVGTLVLSGTNTYSGTTTINAGGLRLMGVAARGNSTNFVMNSGALDLRSGSASNFGINIDVAGNSAINTDDASGVHTVGNVTLTGTGPRTLTQTGGMGLQITNLISSNTGSAITTVNGQAAVIGSFDNTLATFKTWTINGSGTVAINGPVTQSGGGTVAIAYGGNSTLAINGALNNTGGAIGATGGGTVVVNTAMSTGGLVNISNGTIDLSGAGAITHNMGSLSIGSNSQLTTGAGTLALTGDVTRLAGGGAATLTGNLSLAAGNHNFAINSTGNNPDLTVSAAVSGAGGLTKTGAGELRLGGVNTFAGGVAVNSGTLTADGQATGSNSLSAGPAVINGGTLRLLSGGAGGEGAIGALTFGDTAPASVLVDSSGGNATLTIASLDGRVGGTAGTLRFIPGSGNLGTSEVIKVTSAPTLVNGMLPAHTAIQRSSGDNTLDFATVTAGQLATATYSGTPSGTTIWDVSSDQSVGGTSTAFAVRNSANISGSGTLIIGNGTDPAGLILNNGQVTVSNLSFGTSEAVVWAGSGNGTIASNLTLNGNFTASGASQVALTGALNLGTAARTFTTAGTGSLVISGAISNGAGGALVKAGDGTLILSGNSSASYSGTTTISRGAIQVSASGALGTGPVVNNSTLVFNVGSDSTFSNAISGTGGLTKEGGNNLSLSGNLTYAGQTLINSGTITAVGANRLPASSVLAINSGATFNLNGSEQTVGGLANGAGTGGAITTGVAGAASLVINTDTNNTFTGAISNGLGTLTVVKRGTGTQTLNAASTYTGGTRIEAGTLYVGDTNAGTAALGTGTVTLAGGTLALHSAFAISGNGGTMPNPITVPAATTGNLFVGNRGAASGTLTGAADSVLNVMVPAQNKYTGNNSNTNAGVVTGNWTGFLGQVQVTAPNGAGNFRIGANGTANVYPKINLNSGVTMYYGPNPPNNTAGVDVYLGELTGTTGSFFGGSSVPGRFVNIHVGSLNTNSTFNGVLEDSLNAQGFTGAGVLRVDKVGTGTWTVTGQNTYTGATTITLGTMAVAPGGALNGTPTITIASTGTLMLQGTNALGAPSVFVTASGTLNTSAVPGGFATPAGMTLLGNGTVTGNYTHGAGTIDPGGVISVGTLTLANNLTLSGGSVVADLGAANIVGGGSNDLVKVAGDINFASNSTFRANFLTLPAVNDVFPIISYGGTKTGSFAGWSVLAGVQGTFSLVESTPGVISIKVDSINTTPNLLTWTGGVNNVWNVNTTKNWTSGIGSQTFFQNDAVTFNDTGSNTNVSISGVVLPSSVTVNNSSLNYTIGGPGTLAGSTGIVKSGTGTLSMNGNHDFTGGITVNSGTLHVLNGEATALGTITLNGTSALTFNSNTAPFNGTLTVNGDNRMISPTVAAGANQNVGLAIDGTGTLTVFRNGSSTNLVTLQRTMANFSGTLKVDDANVGGAIRFNAGGTNDNTGSALAIFDLGNGTASLQPRNASTNDIGALIGGPNTSLDAQQSGTGGTVIYNIGARNLSTTFQGRINDDPANTRTVGVNKVGTATLTLTNDSTYRGTTNVNSGTLELQGSNRIPNSATIIVAAAGTIEASSGGMQLEGGGTQTLINNGHVFGQVTAPSGRTVGGSGEYHNGVVVQGGGIVAPGASVGVMTTNTLSLDNSALSFEIGAGAADRVNVTASGGLTLNGTSTFTMGESGGLTPIGQYPLIDYSGTALVDLSNFSLSSGTTAHYTFSLVNNTANTSIDLLITAVTGVNAQWNVDADGNWSAAANWTPGVPLIADDIANFGAVITAARTVTVDAPQTVGTINFNNANAYTVAGASAITLDVSSGSAGVNVLAGSHTISAPVTLSDDLVVSSAAGTGVVFSADITATGKSITKAGAGTTQFENVRATALNVTGGTALIRTRGGPNASNGTSVVQSLSISTGAVLDLTNNSMVIDYTTVGTLVDDVRQHLQAGRLTTSATTPTGTKLGYMDNNDGTPLGTFQGQTVDATSLLIKYTYAGDSNLDGQVDITDLAALATAWQTNGVWVNGDFDYTGFIDITDLAALATNWQVGVGAPLAMTFEQALASVGLGGVAVPEPATLGLLAAGALGLRRRRHA